MYVLHNLAALFLTVGKKSKSACKQFGACYWLGVPHFTFDAK
jgi:hypothetical protein